MDSKNKVGEQPLSDKPVIPQLDLNSLGPNKTKEEALELLKKAEEAIDTSRSHHAKDALPLEIPMAQTLLAAVRNSMVVQPGDIPSIQELILAKRG
jgi:hypothetical protein